MTIFFIGASATLLLGIVLLLLWIALIKRVNTALQAQEQQS